MTGALWIVFAVAAIACTWLEGVKGETPKRFDWVIALAAVVGVAALFLLKAQFIEAQFPIPFGVLIASALALALSFWKSQSVFGLMSAGAIASLSVMPSSAATVVAGTQISPLFMVFSVLGILACALAWGGNARGGTAFAGMGALVGMSNYWTPAGFGREPNSAGTLIALGVVAAAVVVLLLRRGNGAPGALLAGGLGALIVVVSGFFVGEWGGDDTTLPVTIFAAMLAAFTLVWMVSAGDQTQRANQQVLGGLTFMGLATFAFAQDQSFGLTLAALAAFGGFVLMGRVDLTSVMGPVLGLACYRTFRHQFPDVTRGFDIAQHYGMVGLMIGAGLILFLLQVPRLANGPAWKSWSRFGVLGIMVGTATVVGLFFFGLKGSVGLMIGLGLGVWLAGIISVRGSYGTAPLLGLAGLTGLSYGEVSQAFDLAREPKMTIFLWASGALIALGAVLTFVLADKAPVGDQEA